MTTDWVTATKWLVGRSGRALPSCSAPKTRGTGRAVTNRRVGEESKRTEEGCSSNKGTRTLLTCREASLVQWDFPFPSHTDVPNNQHTVPPKNPPDCRLTSENTTQRGKEWRLTSLSVFSLRNREFLPPPAALQSQWQPNLHQYQREDEEIESLIHILTCCNT